MKKMQQIFFLSFALTAWGVFLGVASIQAQPYPAHTLQVVIPGAPGDALDLAGSVYIWGQPLTFDIRSTDPHLPVQFLSFIPGSFLHNS